MSKGLPLKHYRLIAGLGTSCTIGYGTLFYSFSLLSLEINKTFSWSTEFIYGVYSLGILLSGILAPFIGKSLDKCGVYRPMALGSLLVASSLYGLSAVETKHHFVASLLLMEIASILVLYESAFVALSHSYGQQARLAISQITLIAGFASTIFWPLISYLLSIFDWRTIYIFMALLHIVICLPIHFYLLKPITRPSNSVIDSKSSDKNRPEITTKNNWHTEIIVALSLGFIAFCIAGLQIHLFGIMSSLQLTEKIVVIASSLIGPAQVFSRLADLLLGKYITPLTLGIISIGVMILGIISLLFAVHIIPFTVILFAIFFGLGQGLTYIVRGSIPLFLFGSENYGTITGRMNSLRMVLTALAPISFSIIIDKLGITALLILLCFLMFISLVLISSIKLKQENNLDL